MASPPGGGRSPAWCYIPPLVRAALAWLFVICLTQVDGSTFYVLVRGVGAVEYSDAIVVGSHALDFGVLAVVTALFGLSVLAVVAVVGNVRWVVGGFDGSTPFSDPSWSFSFVGLQIIALLDPILPEITLVMLFGWVAWLLLPLVSRSAKAWMSAGCPGEGSAGFGVAVSRRASFVMLGAAVLISVFVGAYPYLHAVNPNSLIVGVDPRYCYSRILDGLPGLGYPCGGPRPGTITRITEPSSSFRGLSLLGGSPLAAFQIAFPVLAVLLTLSTYAFVNEGTGSGLAAGVGALFASCSL